MMHKAIISIEHLRIDVQALNGYFRTSFCSKKCVEKINVSFNKKAMLFTMIKKKQNFNAQKYLDKILIFLASRL